MFYLVLFNFSLCFYPNLELFFLPPPVVVHLLREMGLNEWKEDDGILYFGATVVIPDTQMALRFFAPQTAR